MEVDTNQSSEWSGSTCLLLIWKWGHFSLHSQLPPDKYSEKKKTQKAKLNKGFIAEILGKQFGSGISSFSNVVHKGKYWRRSSTVRNLEYLTRKSGKRLLVFPRSCEVFGVATGSCDSPLLSCDFYRALRYKLGVTFVSYGLCWSVEWAKSVSLPLLERQ